MTDRDQLGADPLRRRSLGRGRRRCRVAAARATAVRPSWVLRNTGTGAVTIGEPTAEVREGCCPGPFTLSGPATLAPGDTTTLSFELSLHPGMDGRHDIAVQVPVRSGDGSMKTLDLGMTGDFRG